MRQAVDLPHPGEAVTNPRGEVGYVMEKKGFWRAFLDFFVLFSGISTKSNLARTRKAPVVGRGLFLFRKTKANG
ncbi:MAG TPA: hypothetical protein VMD29_13405 [Terracidiphilus sp.]|nr:hypothetical protein [Terracidiphilus sp.]